MKDQLEKIKQLAEQELDKCENLEVLENLRVKFLGKKGELTAILKQMGSLSAEERPVVGKLANTVRSAIEEDIAKRTQALKGELAKKRLEEETVDVTLPGNEQSIGKLHPLTVTLNDIKETFLGMGFEIAEGPEVETDHYCFEALNMPKHHPARDTQDTFYINENVVLRTQTSSVQIRTMEN